MTQTNKLLKRFKQEYTIIHKGKQEKTKDDGKNWEVLHKVKDEMKKQNGKEGQVLSGKRLKRLLFKTRGTRPKDQGKCTGDCEGS